MNTYLKVNIPVISGGSVVAADVTYDNSGSGLTATNIQDAIDELASSGSASYVDDFIVADWNLDSGLYKYEILEAAHGKGVAPIIQVQQTNGLLYDDVQTGIEVNASGDITLTISSSPDLRFDGRSIIK